MNVKILTCNDLSRCLSSCPIFSHKSSFSSAVKMLGTSPEFSKLFMSSKNDSSFICQGVNKQFSQYRVSQRNKCHKSKLYTKISYMRTHAHACTHTHNLADGLYRNKPINWFYFPSFFLSWYRPAWFLNFHTYQHTKQFHTEYYKYSCPIITQNSLQVIYIQWLIIYHQETKNEIVMLFAIYHSHLSH